MSYASPLTPFFVRHSSILWSGLLLGVGLGMAQLSNSSYLQVLAYIQQAILAGDNGPLILASGLMALLNTIVMLPVFAGIFHLEQYFKNKAQGIFLLFVMGAILAGAKAVALLTQEELRLAAPLLAGLLAYILIESVAKGKLSLAYKAIILFQVIFAAHWLELTPLVQELGFVREDLAVGINLAAVYNGGQNVLNLVGLAFFVIINTSAIFSTILVKNYSERIRHLGEAAKREEELQQARLSAVEARVSQEVHTLVHDLKTPLTTVMGLTSLLEMRLSGDKEQEYLKRIDQATTSMNTMISEILYDEVRDFFGVEQLVDYVRANLIIEERAQQLTFSVEKNLPPLRINKIRVARAIMNVVENGLKAIKDIADGRVEIRVTESSSAGKSWVRIAVWDNGVGIPAGDMDKIWEIRFSTGDTPGLGLDFVKRVVEGHGGIVNISSQVGRGTLVEILLPGRVEKDEIISN